MTLKLGNSYNSSTEKELSLQVEIITLNGKLTDTEAALWEILDKLYASEQMNLDVKGILAKHNIPIPEGKEVW
jgi:hypothetical protein